MAGRGFTGLEVSDASFGGLGFRVSAFQSQAYN